MVLARTAGVTGVKLKFFDALERLRAEGEIANGKISLTSAGGRTIPFDITLLHSTFAGV